jgi:hypothetical protein
MIIWVHDGLPLWDRGRPDCSPRIANALFENFVDPRRFTRAFVDKRAAYKLIAELSGRSWRREFFGGVLRVAAEQLRRVFGTGPAHVGLLPHPS